MPNRPARGTVASLLIILLVSSAGSCARTDAPEAEGTERPQDAAVALATRGGSASVQQGSKITVTLDQRLELPPR